MKRAVAAVLLVWTNACLGCADKPASAPDFSNKPEPGVERPYIKPGHQSKFDNENKGPTDLNPRPNKQGK